MSENKADQNKQEDPSGKESGETQAETQPDPKPVAIKPRKAFVAKKISAPTDKPMEHRVRHIRLSSLETAELFRQTLLDFQKELADEPTDDPDKEFADREKAENFFTRIAKKYSTCPSNALGGELGWVYPGIKPSEIMTPNLIETILQTKKFIIPEPIKSKLGFHLILICESRICKKIAEAKPKLDPRYEALAAKDSPEARAPTRKDIPT